MGKLFENIALACFHARRSVITAYDVQLVAHMHGINQMQETQTSFIFPKLNCVSVKSGNLVKMQEIADLSTQTTR